jgi:hypothetical protein
VLENDSIMVIFFHVAHAGSKKKIEHHKTTWKKGIMFAKSPLTPHNFLKITAQFKTILKIFSTLICIMTHSRCRWRRLDAKRDGFMASMG